MTQCERDYIEDQLVEIAFAAQGFAETETDPYELQASLIAVESAIRHFALRIHECAAPVSCETCKHKDVCEGAIDVYAHHVEYRYEEDEAE